MEDATFFSALQTRIALELYFAGAANDVLGQVARICAHAVKEANEEEFYFVIERSGGVLCYATRVYDLETKHLSSPDKLYFKLRYQTFRSV